MRPHWLFILILLCALGLSGCYRLKPQPPSTAQVIVEQVNDFESALIELDYAKLQELLADQLNLDWQTISKEDIDKIIAFIGDFDEIETAVLTELTRSILDDNVIIDAELYLELIKNQQKYTETKNFTLIFENFGTKWTGDRWLITSMISYQSGDHQYQNPAVDPDELLDRFAQCLLTKAFADLPDLLAYTVVATHGTSVTYYRNNQQFIAFLANDLQGIELTELTLTNREYIVHPTALQVTADLNAAFKVDGQSVQKSTSVTISCVEIPQGLVINRISYTPRFFGFY